MKWICASAIGLLVLASAAVGGAGEARRPGRRMDPGGLGDVRESRADPGRGSGTRQVRLPDE